MERDRLTELERRVERLETVIADLMKEESRARPSGSVWSQVSAGQSVQPEPQVNHQLKHPSQQQTAREPIDWEKLIARVWLPRIFVFVLLFGVIWGFSAAVEAGFINEPVRVILGVIASAALIWFGERQIREKRETLGQVLLGGGVGIFTLSVFAAHYLYDLINGPIAFVVNVAVVAGSLVLAHRHRSEWLALISVSIGAMVPFLVKPGDAGIEVFVGYEVLLHVSFLFYAFRQKLLKLYYAAAFLLHAVFGIYASMSSGDNDMLTYGILLHHLVLLGLTLSRRPFAFAAMLGVLHGSIALTLLWVLPLPSIQTKTALLALFVLYALLSAWLLRREEQGSGVFGSAATFALLLFIVQYTEQNGQLVTMLLLVKAVLSWWVSFILRSKVQIVSAAIVSLAGVLYFFVNVPWEYQVLLSTEGLTWIVLLGSLFALMRLIEAYGARDLFVWPAKEDWNVLVQVVKILLAIAGLVYISSTVIIVFDEFSRNMKYLAVSLSWVVYAVCGIAYGMWRDRKPVRLAGILLIFITLLKVIFIDLPEVSMGVRAVLFLALGLIGILVSRWFYRKS